jgi:hypothetical protein
MPGATNAAAVFQSIGNPVAPLCPPQVITGTFTGAAVDTLDFDGLLHVVQMTGAVAGAGTVTGKIQSSADGSTNWVDVPGAALAIVSTANQVGLITLDLQTCQRFIRYIGTETGTSIGVSVSATGVKKVR